MLQPVSLTSFVSEIYNDTTTLLSSADANVRSLRAVIGGGASSRPTPEALSKKISDINHYYLGLEAPYMSALSAISRTLAEKRRQHQMLSTKKEMKAVQLEIDELEDALTCNLKKVNHLEEERKLIIARMQ